MLPMASTGSEMSTAPTKLRKTASFHVPVLPVCEMLAGELDSCWLAGWVAIRIKAVHPLYDSLFHIIPLCPVPACSRASYIAASASLCARP